MTKIGIKRSRLAVSAVAVVAGAAAIAAGRGEAAPARVAPRIACFDRSARGLPLRTVSLT